MERDNTNMNEHNEEPRCKNENLVKPSNNLVWGILTTIFCCLPLGVVSIVYAAQVDGLWKQGLYEEARHSAKNARNWALASALIMAVVTILYFLVIFTLFGAMLYLAGSSSSEIIQHF